MLSIVCALKSGGDYNPRDVENLKLLVDETLDQDHRFVCYTDYDLKGSDGLDIVQMVKGLPGWWCKLEVFSTEGPAIYLDLDTTLFGKGALDGIVERITQGDKCFLMLQAFNRTKSWASGVMAWNGYFGDVLTNHFCMAEHRPEEYDEPYIWQEVRFSGQRIESVQRYALVNSFKLDVHGNKDWDCKEPQIVCFQGKPRPRDVGLPHWRVTSD